MIGIKEFGNYKKLAVMILNILLVHAAYLLAFLLRYGYPFPEYNYSSYRVMTPYISVGVVILFSIYGLMNVTRKGRMEIVQSVGTAVIVLNILTMAGTFFMRTFSFPRSIFGIAMVLQLVIISIFYLIILEIQRKRHGAKHISVIGQGKQTEEIAGKILRKYDGWFSEMRICQDERISVMNDVVKMSDWVFVCPAVPTAQKHRLMQLCIQYRKELQLVPDFYEIMNVGASTSQMDDVPVLHIDTMRLSVEQRMMKRLIDFVASGMALIILLPLLLMIAICIKITSSGPVLYHQIRVTRDGKRFPLYKFRSMVMDAEKDTGPVLASENDQRITKCGKWLRAWRLDELPQLFNVLKGDMSLVGPRPERPLFVDQFEQKMPHYRYRKTVKAGITGLAQVRGNYSTTAEDKMRLDLLYIRNYSFWLDIIIMLQTLPVVVNMDRAKGVSGQQNVRTIAGKYGFVVSEEESMLRIRKTRK
ncbi:exopolysaccharide biosynthesis polyprenyl glycosylphosphotransferase [Tindallia magadiensis]|uniref:Exopolysaccharide biosynthesis polyprenyl glycosylphosphotransferase n=1 Tax=Tindallia magadiensis TaxID=69895 RepID=A0A1I3D4H0_9FIRM|nr:sugar transferase [Tindallia magadiensis]SFH81630.1 exopolysaccharide biosynthesis polyprenyl glycosylphosphotransferase [Tindallia magadiensis]